MILTRLGIVCILLCCSVACANNTLEVYEIPAFDNFQIRYAKQSDPHSRLKLNPVAIPISHYARTRKLDGRQGVIISALKGETIYKSLVLSNESLPKKLLAHLRFSEEESRFSQKNTELSLVSTWFQAGKSTTFSKNNQYLTHELLLKSDIDITFDDDWQMHKGKWYYRPPQIRRGESIETFIAKDDSRRLLIEINVPKNIPAGSYKIFLDVLDGDQKKKIERVNFYINVVDAELNYSLKDNYYLSIYTMLSIDPRVGRRNTYINGQNNHGSPAYQKKMYRRNVEEISDKGFNSLLITDWRPNYVEQILPIIRDSGFKDVVIYGRSPVRKEDQIVKKALVDSIKANGFFPTFYGYDEPGGNKKRTQQIVFNRKVNALGARSINAVFWDDLPAVVDAIKSPEEEFEYLSVSMGSHGNKEFLNSLPIKGTSNKVKLLSYWHPHVENPVINKLFMGYWLWASGLHGVSPHAYYILPHVSNYKPTKKAKTRGKLSPFNDFAMWDSPKSLFRQHATVYPHQDGVISTLQWEAVADGVTDLVLVNQLESLISVGGLANLQGDARKLLKEIKEQALVKNKSDLSRSDTKKYMFLMESWKSKIKNLIVSFQY